MNNLKKVTFFLILVYCIFYTLDRLITAKLQSIDTKQNWILNLNNQNVDYVVIGSSKSEQGVDISNIEKLTNLSGLNLSCSGCGIQEQYLLLFEFFKKNDCKNVILMVDFTTLDPNQFTYPFHEYLYFHKMDNIDIIESIKENSDIKKFYIWKYIPLIRYAEFNSEFKRMLSDNYTGQNYDKFGHSMPLSKEESIFHRANMFDLKKNSIQSGSSLNTPLEIDDNASKCLLRLINLVKSKNINLTLVSFPENTIKLAHFEHTKRPQVRNYFKSIAELNNLHYLDFTLHEISKNESLFSKDAVHLNSKGVSEFTKLLSDSLLTTLQIRSVLKQN